MMFVSIQFIMALDPESRVKDPVSDAPDKISGLFTVKIFHLTTVHSEKCFPALKIPFYLYLPQLPKQL